LGEFDAAIARSKDAIQVAEAVDHAYSVAVAQWGLAYAYVQRGELDAAVRLLERTIALCRDWTVPILLHISAGLHGIALARSEHVTEGIAVLREAERSFKEAVGAGTYNTLHVLWLGEAYALGHRYPEALETAQRALELVREFNHFVYEGWVLHLLGEIACQSDAADLEAGDGHYRQALALGQERGMRPLVARCHAGLAGLYTRAGKSAEADEHVQIATRMYREMGMTFWLDGLESELKAS
jgi:tetratricopeptide (TPR) repeat protein